MGRPPNKTREQQIEDMRKQLKEMEYASQNEPKVQAAALKGANEIVASISAKLQRCADIRKELEAAEAEVANVAEGVNERLREFTKKELTAKRVPRPIGYPLRVNKNGTVARAGAPEAPVAPAGAAVAAAAAPHR